METLLFTLFSEYELLMVLIMTTLLSTASCTNLILHRYFPLATNHELDLRIRSWWVMSFIFIFVLIMGRDVALFFLGCISFLALKEYFSIIPTRRVDRRVLFWAYVTIICQYYWISINWYEMFIIFIPVYAFLFLPIRLELTGETKGFLKSIGTVQWGLMLFVFSFSHMAYLMVLAESKGGYPAGIGLLFYFVFLAQFNDVAQYIFGRLFGRYKIIPKISPNKTVAGFVGGVVSTVVSSVLLHQYLTTLDLKSAIISGMIIATSGFVGDITVSAIKRDLGIKDSSNAIPGHGGILDRIDSLTYSAPLFFHYIRYMGYY